MFLSKGRIRLKIVEQSYEFITPFNRECVLKRLELIGRTAYKSEDKITEDSASKFVKMLVSKGHEAVIEHCSMTVKFICDRGIAQEITRHRIASYLCESTRYVNYSKDKFNSEITVIEPPMENATQEAFWSDSVKNAERCYMQMIKQGCKPEIARSVLPLCTKCELVVTMNLREWKYFLKLRTAQDAHPQIRNLLLPVFSEFKQNLPEIFDDAT